MREISFHSRAPSGHSADRLRLLIDRDNLHRTVMSFGEFNLCPCKRMVGRLPDNAIDYTKKQSDGVSFLINNIY